MKDKQVFGMDVLPTFELTAQQCEMIDHIAQGRQLANSLKGQDDMDGVYGHYYRAYSAIVFDIFGDEYIPGLDDSGNFTVADWIVREAGGWDNMGSVSDIKYYLSCEMAFCWIEVEN